MVKLSDRFSARYSPEGYRIFHDGKMVSSIADRSAIMKALRHKRMNDPLFLPKGETTRSTRFYTHDGKVWMAGRVHTRRPTTKYLGYNRGSGYFKSTAIAKPIMKIKTLKALVAAVGGATALGALGVAIMKNKKKEAKVYPTPLRSIRMDKQAMLDQVYKSAFNDELQKIATSEKRSPKLTDVAIAGAGALAVSKSKPLITGRETLYHGTRQEWIPSIREKGLKTSGDAVAHTMPVLKELDKKTYKDSLKFTYATPAKYTARMYAAQAQDGGVVAIRKRPTEQQLVSMMKIWKKAINPFNNSGVVSLSIPTWDPKYSKQINPEAVYLGKQFGETVQGMGGSKNLSQLLGKKRMQYLQKRFPAFNPIPAEFVRGSKSFRPFYKDLARYAKAKPLRLAAGVGMAGVGLAAIGYGAGVRQNPFDRRGSHS